jgi:6-pyruvoyl-tetrahydropterin synthase
MSQERQDLTGAGWYFSASHRDPVRNELHGHSYEVMVYWPAVPPRDALVLQEMVKAVLVHGFDHKTLPDEITRAEQLARQIGGLLPDAVRVDISRPSERLACQVWL